MGVLSLSCALKNKEEAITTSILAIHLISIIEIS